MKNLYDNIDFRYPTSAGTNQYDFNTGNVKTVYRGREPVRMVYPAMKVEFLPTNAQIGATMNSYYTTVSGIKIYAYGELEYVSISVYAHQQCKGDSGTGYHGRIVADSLLRRTEKHVKKYWPALLSGMEAQLKPSLGFVKTDLSALRQGTERQGYELAFYVVTTNKWDHLIDDSETPTEYFFTDAVVSGLDNASYDAGQDYTIYRTISGLKNLVT